MTSLAWVSQDGILAAVIAVGLLVLGGIVGLVKRSWSNGDAIDRIESQLSSHDLSKMKSQVDELWMDRRETWRYLKERGDMEALNLGLAKRNSPLAIAGVPRQAEIERLYTPYLPQLIEIHKEIGLEDESVLFEAIAKRLGEALTRDVCPAIKTDKGGCVALAIAFLKRHIV